MVPISDLDKSVSEYSPDELVSEYDDFVRGIATNLMKKLKIRIDPEDVVAYGFQGLLEAYDRYELGQGSQFASYAYYRIRGAILDGCRKEGWLNRDRSATEIHLNEYLETAHATQAASPRPTSFGEAIERVAGMVGEATTVVLLDQLDEDSIVSDTAVDEDIVQRDLRRLLKSSLRLLTSREHEIIVLFYFKGVPMKEIGARYGHSKSWVSRMHKGALEKMYEHIEANL